MIEAIKTLVKETQSDWFSIVLALKDRNILGSVEIKHIENYFFDWEEQHGRRYR